MGEFAPKKGIGRVQTRPQASESAQNRGSRGVGEQLQNFADGCVESLQDEAMFIDDQESAYTDSQRSSRFVTSA